MRKRTTLALAFLLGSGPVQALPASKSHPRRASPRAVIAFIRKDLGPLPVGTRFKRVHWNPTTQEWEVTLEPPYIRGVWLVNPMATDHNHMCFF